MYSSADVITLMPNYFAEKNRAGARFQNELNGMEHMRTGPLLIRQQIVMQVFKDGVPQPPYLYASFTWMEKALKEVQWTRILISTD